MLGEKWLYVHISPHKRGACHASVDDVENLFSIYLSSHICPSGRSLEIRSKRGTSQLASDKRSESVKRELTYIPSTWQRNIAFIRKWACLTDGRNGRAQRVRLVA